MIDKPFIQKKILNDYSLKSQLAIWRFQEKKVVFTNGCFDLLHIGHLEYLLEARYLGDLLLVGINTDDSVRRIKGEDRPVMDEAFRKYHLASLVYVDAVIPFKEDTPRQLIQTVEPDVLVKGGDWDIDDIVGSDFVLANGGKVLNLPYQKNQSTTGIIEKIRTAHQ